MNNGQIPWYLMRLVQEKDRPGVQEFLAAAKKAFYEEDAGVIRAAAAAAPATVSEATRLYVLGATLMHVGQYGLAIDALKKAADMAPGADVFFALGFSLWGENRKDEAREFWRAAVKSDGSEWVDLQCRCWAAFHLKLWSVVEATSKMILTRFPNDTDILRAAILPLWEKRRFRKALGYASRIVKASVDKPTVVNYLYWMARCQLSCGRCRSARRTCQRALALDRGHEDSEELLKELRGENSAGLECFEQKHFVAARTWLRLAARFERPRGMACLYLGAVETILSGKVRHVAQAVRKTRGQVPEDVACRVFGVAQDQIGRTQEGLRQLRRAVDVNPSPWNFVCLACTLYYDGQAEEARVMAERALLREPGCSGALFCLALIEPCTEKAKELLERAREANPYDQAIDFQFACVLEKEGSFREACKRYEDLICDDYVAPAEAWLGAARCYEAMGQMDDARLCLQEAAWHDAEYEEILKSFGQEE